MKKILFLLLVSTSAFAQEVTRTLTTLDFVSELKAVRRDNKARYYVYNGSALQDNKGGLYYFDSTSVEAEDLVFGNVIAPNFGGVGRFKRANARNMTLPNGYLKMDGGTKRIILTGTTPASGIVTYYLTTDGTATGNAILTATPWKAVASPTIAPASTSNDIINGQCTSLSADRKVLTCIYGRGSSSLINTGNILNGLMVLGFQAAPAGTPVSVEIEGL